MTMTAAAENCRWWGNVVVVRQALKKQEKERNKEAIVAAFLGETRDLAEEVKKRLVSQHLECPECPYCGGDYGEEPHAHHIYPVLRGGLSTLENMVLVCGSCNLKKSDKTLREFIQTNGMNGTLIHENLMRLRKYF
jgi:5-methylcytosine-specific restriction endonuclease McrA